ncbi:MAG: ComF family protein [Chloroflexi bacterium]|nr:ComF family protein [Chloroflexota bacterium]
MVLHAGSWKDRLLGFFFPRRCLGCGREGRYLCAGCLAASPVVAPPWCPRCGLHLPAGQECRSCQRFPLRVASVLSAYAYRSPVREAIIQLKYHGVRTIGLELAELLARCLEEHSAPVDLLVPVPMHPARRRERGYNQAEVLGEALSRLLGLPLASGALQRVRPTPAQARLTREERWQNLAGAFAAGPTSVADRRVLLVDDVCTTGATLSACADALETAGATSVWGLTVAREE